MGILRCRVTRGSPLYHDLGSDCLEEFSLIRAIRSFRIWLNFSFVKWFQVKVSGIKRLKLSRVGQMVANLGRGVEEEKVDEEEEEEEE